MSLPIITRFAPSDGLPAPRQCAHRFFQLSVGAQKRRTIHLAHRGYGCRAQRAAIPRPAAWRSCAGWAWIGTRGRTSAVRPRPTRNRERGRLYAELFGRLEAEARAYACYCTAEELELSRRFSVWRASRRAMRGPAAVDGGAACRALAHGAKPTLRFAVPTDDLIEFTDLVHGPQKFSSNDIGDFIIRREDGTSAFFFCNAVDDAAMGVTHVLRGDDHLTNTPRQLMLLDALGLRRPGYGHVGLLVGADGAPLSKRHGSTSVQEFRERGFLPAALLNHLFRLGHTSDVDGWLPPEEMPAHFRPEHLGRAPARFEESQLMHWQKETLQRMSAAEVGAWLGLQDAADVRGADAAQRRAAGGCGAVGGGRARRAPAARAGGAARHRGGGRGIFRRCRRGLGRIGRGSALLAKILKERTGRKGARSFHALAGRAHRPDARSRACAAAQVDAAGDGAPPARVPCSKFIIH